MRKAKPRAPRTDKTLQYTLSAVAQVQLSIGLLIVDTYSTGCCCRLHADTNLLYTQNYRRAVCSSYDTATTSFAKTPKTTEHVLQCSNPLPPFLPSRSPLLRLREPRSCRFLSRRSAPCRLLEPPDTNTVVRAHGASIYNSLNQTIHRRNGTTLRTYVRGLRATRAELSLPRLEGGSRRRSRG